MELHDLPQTVYIFPAEQNEVIGEGKDGLAYKGMAIKTSYIFAEGEKSGAAKAWKRAIEIAEYMQETCEYIRAEIVIALKAEAAKEGE